MAAFSSPLAALKAFRADPGGFDLAITDMTMPEMTGDKLTAEILRLRPDIPVILCTGFSERITERSAAVTPRFLTARLILSVRTGRKGVSLRRFSMTLFRSRKPCAI